jgi:hypothetical protein
MMQIANYQVNDLYNYTKLPKSGPINPEGAYTHEYLSDLTQSAIAAVLKVYVPEVIKERARKMRDIVDKADKEVTTIYNGFDIKYPQIRRPY